jgi:ribosomal protein S27AE
MKKMCPSCGGVFEQKDTERYCSEKCEKKSKISLIEFTKKPLKKR